jgi:phosphoglycerate dehydrogenase-like enzyme
MINSKTPVFLVNVSRRPIIDQGVLIASIKKGTANGSLLGRALDVTEPEPLPRIASCGLYRISSSLRT